jgi:hypothetical protein
MASSLSLPSTLVVAYAQSMETREVAVQIPVLVSNVVNRVRGRTASPATPAAESRSARRPQRVDTDARPYVLPTTT